MSDWWVQLSSLQRFFYLVAIPSTVILLLQSILTIIGFGSNGDADMDIDADIDVDVDMDTHIDIDHSGTDPVDNLAGTADFRFVTVRGIIAFLTMFGWVGAALAPSALHTVFTILLASAAGLSSMLLIALLFYGISKLQSSGNINYRLAIGKEAKVYIPIPPNREGFGKVQILLQERLLELEAISDCSSIIKTGETVQVIDIFNTSTCVVDRFRK
ncbi:MAG: hypothetical protein JXQ23_04150 [Clostridia bacterium]|nr:hypothetical protein [Clostridia bacterium]